MPHVFNYNKEVKNDKMYVFSDAYKEEIERDLLVFAEPFEAK